MDLHYFSDEDFHGSLKRFFEELNIPVSYIAEEPATAGDILENTYKPDNPAHQLMDDVYFLGMVDDAAFSGNRSLDASEIKSDYDGILIFGITLHERDNNRLPTRSQLAEIARAFNREYYYTPVIAVYKYGRLMAFANTERLKYKQEWREGEKAGKVTLLRDIDMANPHSGHERILDDLKIPKTGKKKVDSFAKLYAYWQDVFSVNFLSKKFYQELSNWYFWAVREVSFPSEPSKADAHRKKTDLASLRQEHNAKNVIRLLTRFLFVWFVKEKKLIPEELFDIDYLESEILKDSINSVRDEGLFKEANIKSVYYKAILQNLFFASLNCPIEPLEKGDNRKRGFRSRKNFGQHRDANYLMRYKDQFKNPEKFLELMNNIVPFLNGGLFECLDNKTDKIYIDGFSDNLVKPHHLIVPDYLFFGFDQEADLSGVVGIRTKAFKKARVRGLISILESYKFTIAENTPIEEDVALDPELLGKVFENLLASYNPETKTTARKQTGSFYTPREIVNYMVDESLVAYLKNSLENWNIEDEELDKQLHDLLSFDAINPFAENDLQKQIIDSLDNCKILDPACGSGAFPMGILQKMVHILQKIDPENRYWQELQLNKAVKETEGAFAITDKKEREQKLIEINDAFDEKINDPDYARKLFLIEDCIYGVDIQPIATQISKLRFFISLIVDQKVEKDKPNFGIIALPNLETKFVAANTLIGIDKPKDQMTLFENQEIRELEKELKDIRHRIFSAKSPATKRRLRDKDKEIREKMSELLVKHGWANETATQLTSWDPYDQNASSPFFDPEWMFGIKDGFDVVIGNPPYKIMTKNNTINVELNYYLTNYSAIKGSYSKNIFTLFIENSISLLIKRGHLCFIIPEGLYKTRSYSSCVRLMEKSGNTKSIVTFSDFVFENAVTGNLIFLYAKDWDGETNNFHFDNNDNLEKIHIEEHKEIREIEKDTVLLKSIATTFKGMVVKDRKSVISEEKRGRKDLFLLGKNISKWKINSTYYTNYDQLIIVGGTKKIEKHNQSPRILIRRTGDTLCCAYLNKPALTESTLYSCWSNDLSYSNKYLIALLNSKVLNHYNKILFVTNQQGFPQILMTDLQLLPIKRPNLLFSSTIEILVSIILFCEDIVIESILNSIIFELYFLNHMKKRNIDILQFVEKDIEEVMRGREFDQLTDDQKEKVISQLHDRWTHPDSEVRNRIKLFAVRSPEILKPILESK